MPLERALAAILAADVVSYSCLIAEDETRTLDALRALRRRLFEPLVAEHRGEVVKRMGDGWLVAFGSVVDAALCAIQVQEGLVDQDRIKLRIGVHLGDIVHEDEDIYGDGVNIAARLQEAAEPGGLLISDAAHESVIGRLDSQFEDKGNLQLKNIARPVRAWAWTGAAQFGAGNAPGVPDTLPLPAKPSIVVLPFENRSSDPEQEYFSDGITDDIITDLSRFDRLFVIARNTSFSFKGRARDVKSIAAQLGVHFVLEGAVRKASGRVRITVQLVDGASGAQIWAERYEDKLEDVFELQSRITEQVIGAMVPQLEAAEMRYAERGVRRFSEADDWALLASKRYADYIRGRSEFDLASVIELAEKAIQIDPGCARGWQTLSVAWSWMVFRGEAADTDHANSQAKLAADRLMALAPNDSLSFCTRGLAAIHRGEWQNGTSDLRRAYEINPNDTALIYLAFAEARLGNTEQAKDLADKGMRINPRDGEVGTCCLAKAMCAFIEGDLSELRHWAEIGVRMQPHAPIRRVLMIAWAIQSGDEQAKAIHLNAIQGQTPNFIPNLFSGAYRPFLQDAHMERLLAVLREGGVGPS